MPSTADLMMTAARGPASSLRKSLIVWTDGVTISRPTAVRNHPHPRVEVRTRPALHPKYLRSHLQQRWLTTCTTDRVNIGIGRCRQRRKELPVEDAMTSALLVAMTLTITPGMTQFINRVYDFVELHRRAAAGIEQPLCSDPEEVARQADALANAIRIARPRAKEGDIFT